MRKKTWLLHLLPNEDCKKKIYIYIYIYVCIYICVCVCVCVCVYVCVITVCKKGSYVYLFP